LLRDLQVSFNHLLPADKASVTLYPEHLRSQIDDNANWISEYLNTGVYKAGFAPDQVTYEKHFPNVFAALNKLEKLVNDNGGPFILGEHMTELDVRVFATLIRFDTIYVQHFKCNLGMIRREYPVLHNWLKGIYWHHDAYSASTDFKHIKENYSKSHDFINPRAITPWGPWPHIEKGYEGDWSKIKAGRVDMPEVLQAEKKLA